MTIGHCAHDWYYVDNDENVDHVYWECGHCYEKRTTDPTLVTEYLNPVEPRLGANIDEEV